MSLHSAAHCDADIGGLERGRVVHAVADRADLIARGLIGADVGELFDARAGAGDGQLFEKTAELHDERDLTRGEVFADADRRDQCDAGDHEQCDIFFVPPSSKKCSSFSIAGFTKVTPFCTIGVWAYYTYGCIGYKARKKREAAQNCFSSFVQFY